MSEKIEAGETKELVLDLKLSIEAKTLAKELIEKWIVNQLDAATLHKLLSREVN